MDTADFDYELPPDRIAQVPVEPRDSARLLVDRGKDATPEHHTVADLPSLLQPGDLVVVNTTRVLPARLLLQKPTGGAVEVFLLEETAPGEWDALIRPSRRVPPGTRLEPRSRRSAENVELSVEVGPHATADNGVRQVRLHTDDAARALQQHGAVPLPPYITTDLDDPERYQTVFADRPDSVAAPTAGLHFTPEILDGLDVAHVELAVGLGTFKPMTADQVEDHHMHEERYRVPAETLARCEQANRVVAIGTTAVRALESAARRQQLEGRTDLFIHRPFDWQVVDVLMTNFHLPRSSLLVLVDAFVGPRWRDLYAEALATGYRFLSFGDAMLLTRTEA